MSESRMELVLNDPHATEALGVALARAYRADRGGQTLYLHGELGAGKTTCARSLLRALGVVGPIHSPTYALVEAYELPTLLCVHVDLYRLQGADAVDELGLRDYLDDRCLMLVEWPERGGAAVPAPDLQLSLRYHDEARAAGLGPCSAAGRRWFDELVHDASLAGYVVNLT